MERGFLRSQRGAMSNEISERIREARARGETLRIVGAGTWLDAGRPCAAEARLELSSHNGITRYEPGDFVLSARAGTSLEEIERAAAQHGQWLTLDPLGDPRGTIGATVATASYGPLASAFGTPRDHVLGCEFVSGAGDVIHAGGQVVKNVAGFDLVRLVTGAWGTLGVITEVTLRMRALPEVDRTVAVPLAEHGAANCWKWLRESEFTPLAAELISPSVAEKLGLGSGTLALMRFGGNKALVTGALSAASALGEAREVPTSTWQELRAIMTSLPTTFRVSALPSRIDELWKEAMRSGGLLSANVARGVVRCATSADSSTSHGMTPDSLGMTRVYERIAHGEWPMGDARANTAKLHAGIKATFDPDGVLNSGILPA